MQSITVIGCVVIVGMAMITDPSGTTSHIITIITARGFTWIIKKIIGSLNKDASDIINFAGWAISGVTMVKILKNSIASVKPVTDVIVIIGDAIGGLSAIVNKVLEMADKITIWN